MSAIAWKEAIEAHYRAVWGLPGEVCPLPTGPNHELPSGFGVLKYPPHGERAMWTYATRCMSRPEDEAPIELHMFSPRQAWDVVELLTVTAHFHLTGARLDLWHSVNFGRPWLDTSACDRGYISLPYLDGPKLETMVVADKTAKFYWLIPITEAEVAFKQANGIEALEQAFERARLDYLNPQRASTV